MQKMADDDSENMAKAQALFNQLQAMNDEAQSIAQKISELDQERHEHSLVAETLEKLDADRKCFRCGDLSTAVPLLEDFFTTPFPHSPTCLTACKPVCPCTCAHAQHPASMRDVFESRARHSPVRARTNHGSFLVCILCNTILCNTIDPFLYFRSLCCEE